MVQTADVIAALTPFGIERVAVIPVEGTQVAAIRIIDQTFEGPQGHETLSMIARDIVVPLGLELCSFASNARYEGDNAVGAVIHVRNLECGR